jgi:molybdate transport system ATP-binding protein
VSVGNDLEVDAVVRRADFTLRVRFEVAAGEVLAVLGPNGSGKTTLLRALAGLTPLHGGRVELAGTVLDDVTREAFLEPADRPVGLVFQNYRLFPHLSVLDNVAFSPRVRGRSRKDSRQLAQRWLDRLGIGELASRRPAALSGGQAQRVALARALAGEPGLLLLDEPLAALDARTRLDVQAELKRHLSEFAGPCVLVTHDPLEALLLADRLLVIEGGGVVQEGPPAQVARRPATEYVARLVGLNLYAGRADGDHVVLDKGGGFVVPDHGQHGEVLVAVRPSSLLVSTQPPVGLSVRNTWQGRVAGLAMLTDRVRLDVVGEPPAIVDLTPAAVSELALGPGSDVWLSVKATDLEVYAGSESPVGDPSR